MTKFLMIFITVLNTFAAIPTMEGLFRNSFNPDIDKDLIVATLKVTSSIPHVESVETSQEVIKTETAYYKFLYNYTNEIVRDMIIVKYPNAEFNNDQIVDVKYFTRNDKAIENDPISERALAITSLTMFVTNSSTQISKFLKRIDPEFRTNSELVNLDKKALLEKYKSYLKNKKQYEEKKKDLDKSGATLAQREDVVAPVSPLTSENDDDKKKIKQLMSNSLYVEQNNTVLKKEGFDFFWVLETQKIKAKFRNDTHQLKNLKILTARGEVNLVPSDFVAYQGSYFLPKSFNVKSLNVDTQFEILNYYLINSKNKAFTDRIDEYKKYLSEAKKEPKPTIPAEESVLLKTYFY